jgi:hypothetical protein
MAGMVANRKSTKDFSMANPHAQKLLALVGDLLDGKPVPSGEAELTALIEATSATTRLSTPVDHIHFGQECLALVMKRIAAAAAERAPKLKTIPEV